jgi:acyl carrier protein
VRALVPEDLVPQSFVELDELPRLADGAIDRARLPDPFAKQEAAVGPRNEMEKVIATLWQELLGVDAVGVHDNFFDIGGHSLLSVRFISRLDKKIGVRLQHEHVVVNTLEQLASKCSQMAGGASAAPAASGAAPAPAATPTPAAAPAAPAKPKGLFGAVKQAVMGSKSS